MDAGDPEAREPDDAGGEAAGQNEADAGWPGEPEGWVRAARGKGVQGRKDLWSGDVRGWGWPQ